MRVPSLSETQAHLRQFGYDLLDKSESGSNTQRYWLQAASGEIASRHESLLSFWTSWLELVPLRLRSSQLCQAFTSEFKLASGTERETMLANLKGHISGRNNGPFNDWVEGIIPYDVDDLPEEWEVMLEAALRAKELNGGWQEAAIEIVEALSRIGPDLEERLSGIFSEDEVVYQNACPKGQNPEHFQNFLDAMARSDARRAMSKLK